MKTKTRENANKKESNGIRKAIILFSLLGKEMAPKIFKALTSSQKKNILEEKKKSVKPSLGEEKAVYKEYLQFTHSKKTSESSFTTDIELIILLTLILLVMLFIHFTQNDTGYTKVIENFIEAGGAHIIIFPVIAFLARSIYNKSIGTIIFESNDRNIDSLYGIIGGVVIYAGLYSFDLFSKDPEKGIYLVLLIITGGFIGPIIEELFFRKMVHGYIKKKLNLIAGAVISSLLFSIAHTQFLSLAHLDDSITVFLLYFIAGLLFVFLYEKTKNLYASILAHSTFNILVILLELM